MTPSSSPSVGSGEARPTPITDEQLDAVIDWLERFASLESMDAIIGLEELRAIRRRSPAQAEVGEAREIRCDACRADDEPCIYCAVAASRSPAQESAAAVVPTARVETPHDWHGLCRENKQLSDDRDRLREENRGLRERVEAREAECRVKARALEANGATISSLTAERDELRAQNVVYDSVAVDREQHISSLTARVAELERDARRWRGLRSMASMDEAQLPQEDPQCAEDCDRIMDEWLSRAALQASDKREKGEE